MAKPRERLAKQSGQSGQPFDSEIGHGINPVDQIAFRA
jgi:hypothetical protein